MRKELEELALIDAYLHRQLPKQERLAFEKEIQFNAGLYQNMLSQKTSYAYIQAAGRQQLQEELEQIHQQLWANERYSNFRKRLLAIFKK